MYQCLTGIKNTFRGFRSPRYTKKFTSLSYHSTVTRLLGHVKILLQYLLGDWKKIPSFCSFLTYLLCTRYLCQQSVCFSHAVISPTYVGLSQVSPETIGDRNCFILNNRKMETSKSWIYLWKEKNIRQENNTKLCISLQKSVLWIFQTELCS